MTAEWNDAETFRRHLEEMMAFRRAHPGGRRKVMVVLNKTPVPCNVRRHGNPAGDINLLDARGNPIVVPMWKIESAEGSQN